MSNPIPTMCLALCRGTCGMTGAFRRLPCRFERSTLLLEQHAIAMAMSRKTLEERHDE